MEQILQYLPLLNLLIIPLFLEYISLRERLLTLEIHKERVEQHLGFKP